MTVSTSILGNVCQTFSGGTPSRTKTEYFGGDIPWVKITDMLQGEVLYTDESLTAAGIANSSAKVLPKGTVLISIFATIGRTAVLGIEAATNQAIAGVVPNDTNQLQSDYLRYFLDSKHSELNRIARGVAQPNINQGILRGLEIPIPPISEQRRIVDLLSRAEGIVRLRRDAEKKAAELVPALFIDMFGDPATNPKGWSERRLGDIAAVVSGVTKGRKFGDKPTVEVPYLRVANVQAGHIDLSVVKTIDVLPQDVKQLALQNGDIVLTEGGDFDKLGRGALWEHDIPNCIHQNHVFRVRLELSIALPEFFVSYLQTDKARAYFMRCAKRTTNLASINMTQLRDLPVIVPALPAQQRFVNQFRDARSIQSQQLTATAKAQATFDALLASVFIESKKGVL